MEKLKVAVVGAGIYGKNHLNAYTWNPNSELVAVCDMNPEITKQVKEEYHVNTYNDIEEMLNNEDIDAVSVATPDPYHKEPVLAAIRHGKHVLVEKPLATSSQDAYEIIDAAKEAGVRVMVDYHKRWDPSSVAIKNVAGLLDAVSCLLEAVVRLLQSIKKLKKTIMYKSHKKKLPHNSRRNKR